MDPANNSMRIELSGPNKSTLGVFSGVTHNGHKESVVKSCYQKYVRLGMFE